jgi:hypothetical protein
MLAVDLDFMWEKARAIIIGHKLDSSDMGVHIQKKILDGVLAFSKNRTAPGGYQGAMANLNRL